MPQFINALRANDSDRSLVGRLRLYALAAIAGPIAILLSSIILNFPALGTLLVLIGFFSTRAWIIGKKQLNQKHSDFEARLHETSHADSRPAFGSFFGNGKTEVGSRPFTTQDLLILDSQLARENSAATTQHYVPGEIKFFHPDKGYGFIGPSDEVAGSWVHVVADQGLDDKSFLGEGTFYYTIVVDDKSYSSGASARSPKYVGKRGLVKGFARKP